jgi:hypothetical protein
MGGMEVFKIDWASMKYIRLYEHYPDADPIPVSIQRAMRRAEEELGIPRYLSKIAIKLLLYYYSGEQTFPAAKSGAKLLSAIDYWQGCYIAMMEDGYGSRQIDAELEKVIADRD